MSPISLIRQDVPPNRPRRKLNPTAPRLHSAKPAWYPHDSDRIRRIPAHSIKSYSLGSRRRCSGDEKCLPNLRGHIARKNPQAKVFTGEAQRLSKDATNPHILEREVMVLFNGPVHHYATPKFYVKTKPETGKVVPTWNYSAVEAYGTATVYIDHKAAETTQFLSKQIRDLSQQAETRIMGYSEPWMVEDAPAKYVELLAANIIGIEIRVHRLGGKFKMSQELGKEDVRGVVDGFENLGTADGAAMASIVKERNLRRM